MIPSPVFCLSIAFSILISPIFAGPLLLRADDNDSENSINIGEDPQGNDEEAAGFAVTGEFLCNGLPLIGAVQILDEAENCSQIVLHLDIPDRETTLDLLEPFQRWNASFQIICSQRASRFDPQTPPVITVIHNCSPRSNLSESNSDAEEQVCRKWEIEVPEENVGPAPKIVDLGTQELSEHGEEIDCPESVSLMMRMDDGEDEEAEEEFDEAVEAQMKDDIEIQHFHSEEVTVIKEHTSGGEEEELVDAEEEGDNGNEQQQGQQGTSTQMPPSGGGGGGSNGEEREDMDEE